MIPEVVFSWDIGINGDIGNIVFSWDVPGMGISGRCPSQLEFDIFDPSDSLIDSLATPDFSVTLSCPELNIESQPFFIDSRSVPNHVCHVVCYDRLSRVDVPFSTSHDWNVTPKMTSTQVLLDICRICGFEGSSVSGAYGGLQYIDFTRTELEGKTCGEILDVISTAMVGVWTSVGSGLNLLCLGASGSTSVSCGENHTEIEYLGRTAVIGLVMKNSTKGETYEFGSSSENGYVVQAESGYITKELAEIIWQRVQGYQYKAWDCKKALVENFPFYGPIQFVFGGGGGSLESPLFPRSVRCDIDSTGIYFSGGRPAVDEWNYKSKLEREKIGIGKAVGNTSVSESGRVNFINLN